MKKRHHPLFALMLAATGCYASHLDEGSAPDAGIDTRSDAAVADAPLERPTTPPVRAVCDPGAPCTLTSSQPVDAAPDDLVAWLPEAGVHAVRNRATDDFEVHRGARARRFLGSLRAALATEESVVLNVDLGGVHRVVVLARDSLETIATLEPEPPTAPGWIGLASVGAGFGAMRVARGGVEPVLWWDAFDARGTLLSASSFVLPPGGWHASPHYTSLAGLLVFGWRGVEGCARALWFRNAHILAETVLHCPTEPDCGAEPIGWTREREGRVGVAVRVVCEGEEEVQEVRYLVGTLGGRSSTASLVDVCATRVPIIALEPDGGLRALVTRGFVVHDLRFTPDLRPTAATQVADRATGLALSPDEGLVYGTIEGEVFHARCAP